ncbi:unnamed protein product [Ixodes pacificus]
MGRKPKPKGFSYQGPPASTPGINMEWTQGEEEEKASKGAPDREITKIETGKYKENPEDVADHEDDREEEEEAPPRPRRRRRRGRGTTTAGQWTWVLDSTAVPTCVVLCVTVIIASIVVIMVTQTNSTRQTKQKTIPTTEAQAAQFQTEVTSSVKPQARMEWEPAPPYDDTGLGITDYQEPQLDNPTRSVFQCSTEACRWQRSLVDDKLNLTVDPCKDFYAYVCSAAWDSNGALPYKAAGQTYIIGEVLKFIGEHGHSVPAARTNRSSLNFLDHSSIFLLRCLDNSSSVQGLMRWDGIRGLLREVGLDGWPYVDRPTPPFHLDDVLKLVDRRLAIFAFMRVFLRKTIEDGVYVPHLDSPNNFLLVRYELLKNPQSLPYKEVIRKVLTLWKSLRKGNALAHDVIRLEEELFNASQPFRKPVWRRNMVVPIQKLPRLPRLHLDAYLLHLRQDSKEVVILNPTYIAKLSTLLQKSEPRTLLNLLGVWVVVLTSPFSPQPYLPRELLNMSHPNHQSHLDPMAQSCFHLIGRLFPHGVRWMLRRILTRTANPDRQWETMTTAVVSALANSLKEGTSWMEKFEAAAVATRLRSLRVSYLAGREPLEQVSSYYPVTDVTFPTSTSLKYYTDLLERTLQKYWESEEGSDLDARYSESFVTSDQNSNWERSPESPSNIYLASSSLASASLVTRSAVPSALIPLIAGDLARALFLSSLGEANWTAVTQDRFRELEVCLLERYKKGRYSNTRDFLMVALSDNAVLKPLAIAFKDVGYGAQFVPGNRGANLTLWRLFFANFAAGFCVPGETAHHEEDRMKWRLSLPARLRVNTALLNSPEFRHAFKCPERVMASQCSVWGSRGAAKVAEIGAIKLRSL